MRAKHLVLAILCSCAGVSSENRTQNLPSENRTPDTSSTSPGTGQPYRAMVPEGAVAVTHRAHTGDLVMHGQNFDGSTRVDSVACLNIREGTEVIEWTGPGRVEFSNVPCVDFWQQMPADGKQPR